MICMSKRFSILLISLILLTSMFSCTKADEQGSDLGEDIPREVADFIVNYYETFKKSAAETRKYRHYESEEIKQLINAQDGTVRVLEYEITEAKNLSDKLYAFKLSVLSTDMLPHRLEAGEHSKYYNFVAKIDDEWFVCPSIYDIPEDIAEGVDLSTFQPEGTVIGSLYGRDIVDIEGN